jgi:hypothetical protein
MARRKNEGKKAVTTPTPEERHSYSSFSFL